MLQRLLSSGGCADADYETGRVQRANQLTLRKWKFVIVSLFRVFRQTTSRRIRVFYSIQLLGLFHHAISIHAAGEIEKIKKYGYALCSSCNKDRLTKSRHTRESGYPVWLLPLKQLDSRFAPPLKLWRHEIAGMTKMEKTLSSICCE